MYVMIQTIGTENVKPEEPVVLKYDSRFGRAGAFAVGGELLGYASENPPAGCMEEWDICSRIGDNRVIARAAVVMQGGIILQTDSPVLTRYPSYNRIEREGYGILVRA